MASNAPTTNLAQLKEPPHADEAELAVLGGVFIRNDAIDQVADTLHEQDFYRGAHQKTYAAMLSLHRRREPIDPITLTQELENQRIFDDVGGLEFIARLGSITPTSANVAHYARIVREKSVLR
ncbi:replicative DNA helicase, partial [bacterium]|nr:replicative DNA helicase [bacterium]